MTSEFLVPKYNGKKVESDGVKFMFVEVNVFIDVFLILKIVKAVFVILEYFGLRKSHVLSGVTLYNYMAAIF